MEFYKDVFGGKLVTSPNGSGGIMHADLSGGEINLMGCDSTRTTPYEMSCISLSLNGTDSESITAVFKKLSEGGTVTSPLQVESWGDTFGTLTDRFGIDWMVNISSK